MSMKFEGKALEIQYHKDAGKSLQIFRNNKVGFYQHILYSRERVVSMIDHPTPYPSPDSRLERTTPLTGEQQDQGQEYETRTPLSPDPPIELFPELLFQWVSLIAIAIWGHIWSIGRNRRCSLHPTRMSRLLLGTYQPRMSAHAFEGTPTGFTSTMSML